MWRPGRQYDTTGNDGRRDAYRTTRSGQVSGAPSAHPGAGDRPPEWSTGPEGGRFRRFHVENGPRHGWPPGMRFALLLGENKGGSHAETLCTTRVSDAAARRGV